MVAPGRTGGRRCDEKWVLKEGFGGGLVSVPAENRRARSGKVGVSGSHGKCSGNLELAVAGLWPLPWPEGEETHGVGCRVWRRDKPSQGRPCRWGARGNVP